MSVSQHLNESYMECSDELMILGFSDEEQDEIDDDDLMSAVVIDIDAPPTLTENDPNIKVENGRKYYKTKCQYCGEWFWALKKRGVKRCKSKECWLAYSREWHKKRQLELSEEAKEYMRAKKRTANRKRMREVRYKEKALLSAKEQAKRIIEQDKKFTEHGLRYGEYQAEKLLAQVPKIDVNL